MHACTTKLFPFQPSNSNETFKWESFTMQRWSFEQFLHHFYSFFSIIALYFLKWFPPLLLKNQTNQYVKVQSISTFFSLCILIGKSFNGNWLYRGIRVRNFICIVSGAYHGQTKQQDLLFDFVEYRISDIKMTFLNFSPFAKKLICHYAS